MRDVVWALSPCGRPDPDLVVAAGRADALGVLDLGAGGDRAREALATTAARARVPFGVRVGATCPVTAAELPEAVDTVVVAGPDLVSAFRGVGDRRVVAKVVSAAEGRLAIEAGADGLVAKGSESAGRVGTTGAYVLLQQLVDLVGRTGATDEAGADLPVWATAASAPTRSPPPSRAGPPAWSSTPSWRCCGARPWPGRCARSSGPWTARRPGSSAATASTPGPTCGSPACRPTPPPPRSPPPSRATC